MLALPHVETFTFLPRSDVLDPAIRLAHRRSVRTSSVQASQLVQPLRVITSLWTSLRVGIVQGEGNKERLWLSSFISRSEYGDVSSSLPLRLMTSAPAGGEADFWNISSPVQWFRALQKPLFFPPHVYLLPTGTFTFSVHQTLSTFFHSLIFLLFFVQVQSSANGQPISLLCKAYCS